jgi:tetratricopeptide (TPR) repeat protein
MTKITLRSYNREIEVITDQGKIDFAIAHCLHILKYFPKHVDTYRLLGKAYLENQRLGDAADVFQRVLSAVPDDFVSHIGMSIIREDEANLDAAIWHMQRAYDVQSSNITIQDELRRLYDRRDGVEPPKIRLTRAALARMYARGDLVTEAIAELRAALQEEPDRADLLVLLARMYATNQQRVKSIQTCSQVLNKLPYCLEANLIISRSLDETNRFDEAQPYLERARELDPYAAFISDQAPTIDLVPDAAVSLIKLDETELRSYAAAASEQPTWVTTLGSEMPEGSADEEDIDWLIEEPQAAPETHPDIEDFVDDDELAADLAASAAFGSGEAVQDDSPVGDGATEPAELDYDELVRESDEPDIPDWMVEAGWDTADEDEVSQEDEFEIDPEMLETTIPGDSDQGEEDPDDSGLYRAQIPDWLQALAPADVDAETAAEGEAALKFEPESEAEAPAEGEAVPDWLQELSEDEQEEPEPTRSEELPDWLAEMGEPPPEELEEAAEEELPDWLAAMKPDPAAEAAEEIAAAGETESFEEDLAEGEIPAWLRDMAELAETSTSATAGDPDDKTGVTLWLERNVNRVEDEPEIEEGTAMEQPTEEPMEEPTEDSADLPEMDDDEAMRWLEGLAARQGVGEEELLTSPEDRTDTPPEWVRAMGASEDDEPDAGETVMETPAAEDEMDWDEIEDAVGDMTEVEPAGAPDAMDWLESLGDEAEEEEAEFISQPEETVEESPGWETMEETSAMDTDDLPGWLKDQIDDPSETQPSGALPSWLQEIDIDGEEAGGGEEAPAPAEPAGDVPDWLQDLASGESEPFEEVEDDVPDWLQQTMLAASPFAKAEETSEETVFEETEPEETPEAEEEAPAYSMETDGGAGEPADDVPDWLKDMVDEEADQVPAEAGGDVPDWLQQTILASSPLAGEDEPAETVIETPEDEPAEAYAWEQEAGDMMEEDEFVEPTLEGGGETVLEEMEDQPAEEMHAEAEETPAKEEWWERDTGSFERPTFPVDEAVDEMVDETVMETPVEPAVEPVVDEEPAPEIHPAQLETARGALQSGDLETALSGYRSLIQEKANLGEVIEDLERALEYDHPVNVDVWATLGDAYAGNDKLQNALDAYTKAEELLR